MRHRVAAASVALVLIATGGAFPQNDGSPGIGLLVERVQDQLDAFSDLRARFVQHKLSRLGSITTSAGGRLYVQSPGRMRWEYDDDQQLLVAGGPGRGMYHYFPADNQVQVYQADFSNTAEIPILYLAGRGNLRRDFDVELVSTSTFWKRRDSARSRSKWRNSA